MRTSIFLMGLILTGLLTGCIGSNDEAGYATPYGAPAAEPAYSKSGGFDLAASEIAAPEEYTTTGTDTTIDRKIIKTGSISIEVSEFDEAAAVVEQLAAAAGGFVSNSNSYITSEGQKRGTITIRVPAVGFDSVLLEIKKLGDVKSTSSSGQDVTEEYIDLEARLGNYKRQEGRFLSILENATTVEDVLKVEEQLGRVRGEIERIEGRLRYLDNYIDLSTITVSLEEPTPITRKWGLRDALSDSVEGFIYSTNSVIIFVGNALPWIIFLLVLVVIFRRLGRRRHKTEE
jgi:hypothetical protein